MSKTKGSKNYFQGDKLYILKDVLDYIRKNEPSLTIPQSWEHGGGLNGLANKLGIVPDYDNGVEGRGHMTKYKGTTLYKFAPLLIEYLKNTTPKKPRLTPIEVITKQAQKTQEEPQNVPEPEPVEEPEQTDEGLKVPKGFVILRDVEGVPFMIPIKSIIHVSPYCEDRELTNIEYMTEDNKRFCPVSCDSFAIVVDLIRKALEV